MSSGRAAIELGKLEKVHARDAWPDEVRNFTPSLASEGVELLSKEIGVKLKVVSCEHAVGRYSLDILAAPIGSDEDDKGTELIVIENQFGYTDHDHLGKLMTYASGVGKEGKGAKTVIWIAEEFREEHRRAVEWLNEVPPVYHFTAFRFRAGNADCSVGKEQANQPPSPIPAPCLPHWGASRFIDTHSTLLYGRQTLGPLAFSHLI